MRISKKGIISIILVCLIILGVIICVWMNKNSVISLSKDHQTKLTKWTELLVNKEAIVDWVEDDTAAYLIISSEGHKDYGDYLTVLLKEQGTWKRVYDNNFEDLKPWRIKLGDVDGDGKKEILTAVYKTAHYDEVYKNRLFVFNYENGILTKKWTGSKFAGSWKDFYVTELLEIPGEEIIFIEEAGPNKEKISIYYWFDFGFLKLAESKEYYDIKDLVAIDDNLIQITYDDKLSKTSLLTVREGQIIEYKEEQDKKMLWR